MRFVDLIKPYKSFYLNLTNFSFRTVQMFYETLQMFQIDQMRTLQMFAREPYKLSSETLQQSSIKTLQQLL